MISGGSGGFGRGSLLQPRFGLGAVSGGWVDREVGGWCVRALEVAERAGGEVEEWAGGVREEEKSVGAGGVGLCSDVGAGTVW